MQTSMKKYILFPVVLVALVLSSNMVKAQAEDVSNPLLQYINKDKGIIVTSGFQPAGQMGCRHPV